MAYLTVRYFLDKNKIEYKKKSFYYMAKKVAMSDPSDKDKIIKYIKSNL